MSSHDLNQSILIRNGTILPLGGDWSVLEGHSLLIENGVVSRIGPDASFTGTYDRTIDAKHKLVMPGYINAHMHFYSTFARGFGKANPSKNFLEVLNNLWWRLDKALTLDDVYYSTAAILFDAIRSGTTTFIDHHASPHAITGSLNKIAQALTEFGIRGCLCYEVSDRDGETIAREGLSENAEFIAACQKSNNPYLRGLFGLHASFTIGDETLAEASAIGNSLATGFHIHVAEDLADQEQSLQANKQRVIERLYHAGILGSNSIAAHCVHIDDRERELLAETNTIVVHNPQSNMNNAVGAADIIALSQAGIIVGLGSDAMTVRMPEELRTALWLQHLSHRNPSVGFVEVVKTLFENNRKIASRLWDLPIGTIHEGAPADIILVDYCTPTPLTNETLMGHLVFGIANAPVNTTIVNGRILMDDKRITIPIDEVEVAAKSSEAASRLWERF